MRVLTATEICVEEDSPGDGLAGGVIRYAFFILAGLFCIGSLDAQGVRSHRALVPSSTNKESSRSGQATYLQLDTSWAYQYSGVSVRLNGVAFTDSMTGWVCGAGGTIIHTTDGGNTWLQQTSGTPQDLNCVRFFDANLGIAVGAGGTILMTTNGGALWSTKSSGVTHNLNSVAFPSVDTLYTVGDTGVALVSRNGGSTWAALTTHQKFRLKSVAFLNAKLGFAAGDNSQGLSTTNGGAIWQTPTMADGAAFFSDVRFESSGVLLAVGSPYEAVSYDSGKSFSAWTQSYSARYDSSSTIVGSATGGVYVTTQNTIYWNPPGNGETQGLPTIYSEAIHASCLANETVFTAVGDSGMILRSEHEAWRGPKLPLLSPAAGAESVALTLDANGQYLDLTFAWGAGIPHTGRGDATYILEIATDSAFDAGHLTFAFTAHDTSFVARCPRWTPDYWVNTLEGGNTYYWRVLAYGDLWNSDWSDVRSFTTGRIGKNAATLLVAPANGSINLPVDFVSGATYMRFAWWEVEQLVSPLDGTTTYPSFELQVSPDSAFERIVSDTIFPPISVEQGYFNVTIGDSSDWVGGIESLTRYFWRVRVVTNFSYYSWTPAFTFTTGPNVRTTPTIRLDSPLNGAVLPLSAFVGDPVQPRLDTLRWDATPPRTNTDGTIDTAAYTVLYGTDSMDVYNVAGSATGVSTNVPSIALNLLPYATYYWRVASSYYTVYPSGVIPNYNYGNQSIGGSGWSAMRSVTIDLQRCTVNEIQYDDSSYLAICDAGQFSAPEYMQASPYQNFGVSATVRCIVPPNIFTKGGLTMVVQDTGNVSGPWSSIMVQPLASYNTSAYTSLGLPSTDYQAMLNVFNGVHQGDILFMRGYVTETEDTSTMTNTQITCVTLQSVGSSSITPAAAALAVSNFYSGGRIAFSTGEPWEGSLVELQNVTVHSILNAGAGTFDLIDGAGNIMAMTDQSCWFTNASHRNPASTYALPQPGWHIASIRGTIITTGKKYCIAPLLPGDIVMGSPGPDKITGTVFWDDNSNGVQDSGEVTAKGFPLVMSGMVGYNFSTGVAGTFSVTGLDSGGYTISCGTVNASWIRTTPQASIQVNFGSAPESASVAFGFHRNWNTVSGTVFNDLNEDFVPDEGDRGVGGWKVLVHGAQIDSTITDSAGNYTLEHVDVGADTLSTEPLLGWEQIFPQYYYQYIFLPTGVGGSYVSGDFAVHKIPARTKIFMGVHDNSYDRILQLAWGNRGGATYGIAGVDPAATLYDFSEGELELPSLATAIENGFFDARFLDPRAEDNRFGGGSWVDMRDFTAAAQVDTHKVTFHPGYLAGGNYPMTLTWDKASVAAEFTGPVVLVDSLGAITDMKLADSLVVTNPQVTWELIISQGPNLPLDSRLLWRIVSVPAAPLLSNIADIFSLPQTSPYSFNQAAGYLASSSLQPGIGYWLKYAALTGGFSDVAALPSLPESLNVVQGWNLVGGPPVTVSAAGVSSTGSTVLGEMYAFDGGYAPADSVEPFSGYWVHASANGSLIYGAGASKTSAAASTGDVLKKATTLLVADAQHVQHSLYFYMRDKEDERLPDASRFGLPPAPPQGLPDIRFSTGRCLEYVKAGTTTEFTIEVGGVGVYPLTIAAPSMPLAAGVTIGVKVGNKYVSLVKNSTVTLTSPVKSFTLRVTAAGDAAIPREFALRQNYPNPFNPTTTVKYDLPVASNVRLEVYDILGRLVTTLARGEEAAGYKEATWNAANVGSGTYFYRFEATGIADPSKHFSKAMKMVVVK